MTFRAVLIGLAVLLGALGAIVWLSRSQEIAVQQEAKQNPAAKAAMHEKEEQDRIRLLGAPPVSPQGPHPKAVVPRTTYNFGRIAVGEQQQCKFSIKNDGQGMLKLMAGRPSCSCASLKVVHTEVPPGESTNVDVSFYGEEYSEDYRQSLVVLTNDPERREIFFTLSGKCELRIAVIPGYTWHFGEVSGEKPITLKGHIGSPIASSFKILGIESSSPHLKAEFSTMSPEEVAATKCLAAYALKAELSPTFPAGKFEAQFVIRTDLDKGPDTEGTTMVVKVDATKAGPIRSLSASNDCRWYPETRQLLLGRFEAAKGKSTTIPLLIQEHDKQKFEFSDIQSDGKHVHFRLEQTSGPDSMIGGRRRYNLIVEVPPGSPVESHETTNPVTVRAKTNHPDVPEMEFFILYVST